MNLYIFPESPVLTNGYGIIVNSDFMKIKPSQTDSIYWYTNFKENPLKSEGHVSLKRPNKLSYKRFKNMLLLKVGSELNFDEILFLKSKSFNEIFCGDVLFYRAIRKLYPSKLITVRFHNCFSRILDRKNMLDIHLDLKFNIDLNLMYSLEKEIFNDKNVKKIFLSKEDESYYQLITGRNDSAIWGVDVDIEKGLGNRTFRKKCNKLVWFGGVESHKKKSIVWFIDNVLPKIKEKIPEIELHLWGARTEKFNKPHMNIYGYGFYGGNGFPMKDDALYINPDIIGGGVKIKLKTFLEEGVPFITTPFGFEGYNKEFVDNEYCIVRNSEDWAATIINYLKTH